MDCIGLISMKTFPSREFSLGITANGSTRLPPGKYSRNGLEHGSKTIKNRRCSPGFVFSPFIQPVRLRAQYWPLPRNTNFKIQNLGSHARNIHSLEPAQLNRLFRWRGNHHAGINFPLYGIFGHEQLYSARLQRRIFLLLRPYLFE